MGKQGTGREEGRKGNLCSQTSSCGVLVSRRHYGHSRAQAAAQINIPLSSRSAPLPRDAQSSFRVLKLKGGGLENALLTS